MPRPDFEPVRHRRELVSSPLTGVYRGFTPQDRGWEHAYSRGLTMLESHVKMEFPDNSRVDVLLQRQLERAKKAGRDTVVVVDLGAGDANFTRDFLSDSSLGGKTRRYLSDNPGLKLHFLSVTDAASAEDFGRREPVVPAEPTQQPDNTQITAESVGYSITSSQSIKKLFDRLGIDSIDLAVANNFLNYLQPDVFKDVMKDTIDALQPGGQMQAWVYTDVVGSKLSKDDNSVPEDGYVLLKDPFNPDDEGIDSGSLRNSALKLLTDENASDKDLALLLEEVYDGFDKPDVLGATEWAAIDTAAQVIRITSQTNPLRETLEYMVYKILPSVEEEVRLREMRRTKEGILDDLKTEYQKSATIDYKKHALRVRKKITSK